MIVTLPLRLTGSGSRSANSVDLIYDNGVILRQVGIIDSSHLTGPFQMDMRSGYDADNTRITNIVGYDGQNLLKYCPSCERVKPTIEFGYAGRVTNSRRDQSQCNNCRSSY